jgi:hypothetical protein
LFKKPLILSGAIYESKGLRRTFSAEVQRFWPKLALSIPAWSFRRLTPTFGVICLNAARFRAITARCGPSQSLYLQAQLWLAAGSQHALRHGFQ